MTNTAIIAKYLGVDVDQIPDEQIAVEVDGSGYISLKLHEAADTAAVFPVVRAAVEKTFAKTLKRAADSNRPVKRVGTFISFIDDDGWHRMVTIEPVGSEEIFRAYSEALKDASKAAGFWRLKICGEICYEWRGRRRR